MADGKVLTVNGEDRLSRLSLVAFFLCVLLAKCKHFDIKVVVRRCHTKNCFF
jgi:hypothetical protein